MPRAARSTAVRVLPQAIKDVIAAAQDRKARDVVVLDLRRAHGFTDYFVICSGGNPRQVKAIAEAVETSLKAAGIHPNHLEGYEHANWVLIDCFDFIVHVFSLETRTFYDLERLWGNAERIEVTEERTGH